MEACESLPNASFGNQTKNQIPKKEQETIERDRAATIAIGEQKSRSPLPDFSSKRSLSPTGKITSSRTSSSPTQTRSRSPSTSILESGRDFVERLVDEQNESGEKKKLTSAMKNYSVKKLQRVQISKEEIEEGEEIEWDVLLNIEKPPPEALLTFSFVTITVLRGVKLAPKDLNGFSDPYCLVSSNFSPKTYRTDIKKVTLNPKWNEVCEFDIHPSYYDPSGKIIGLPSVKIEVFDHDRLSSDDFMGTNTIELKRLINMRHAKNGRTFRLKVPLETDFINHPGDKVSGHIVVGVELVPSTTTIRAAESRKKLPSRLLGNSWGKVEISKQK
eukprot:TRINITY_DN7553_c0_g1_i1.p1 TRINITY_DN7553_c0_g1~~TRINITY_DN7553_c0_g1_i1.p1  ORF type:complete len:380 (+),score=89.50 TRINITY_DN7553_c0_g1_i1:152-1141(+)